MIPTQERNRQILQLRKAGVQTREVALRFKLSPGRIGQIETKDEADQSMAERRARLQEEIRGADDPERTWSVNDLADAIGLIVVTNKRLLDHFGGIGKERISLHELMEMCLESPAENGVFMGTPLLRVYGVGVKGFWSVANGLTNMDMGGRCNEEWRRRIFEIKRKWRITGATPYSRAQ